MKKNKKILSNCPNFYKIENFDIDNEDYITVKLISIYFEYIFNVDEKDKDSLIKINKLDEILGKYIDDYNFRKEIKRGVLNIKVRRGNDVIETIVNSLISLSESYEDGYTRNIYFARWI